MQVFEYFLKISGLWVALMWNGVLIPVITVWFIRDFSSAPLFCLLGVVFWLVLNLFFVPLFYLSLHASVLLEVSQSSFYFKKWPFSKKYKIDSNEIESIEEQRNIPSGFPVVKFFVLNLHNGKPIIIFSCNTEIPKLIEIFKVEGRFKNSAALFKIQRKLMLVSVVLFLIFILIGLVNFFIQLK